MPNWCAFRPVVGRGYGNFRLGKRLILFISVFCVFVRVFNFLFCGLMYFIVLVFV